MVRLGLAIALGGLLAGTAAQAQGISVDAHQSVTVVVPGQTTFSDAVSGPTGALNGAYSPTGTRAGNSGGAYDTFVTTTPTTVSFQAANTVSGPRVTSISTTSVDLSFKNGANFIENGILESTITPAGLGFYVAGIGSGGCLYTSCSSEGAASFRDLRSSILGSTGGSSTELGTVGVKFQVFRGESTLYDVQASMTLFANSDGFFVDDTDLIAKLSFLDGFGLSTAAASTKAYGYAWSGKDIEIKYGSLNPFEDITLTYLTQVTSTSSAFCARNSDCLIAFAGFGDPIGRGGGIESLEDLAAFDFNSFFEVLDGPVLAGGSSAGPLTGVNFRGASFNLPTFDADTGRLVFVATAAVPEPATWAIMILGFGAVGTALRRRRVLGANA